MDTSSVNKHWRFVTNGTPSRGVPPGDRPRPPRGLKLTVCLGAYFSDERARVALWLPGGARGRPVGWLAERLRRRMRLGGRPALRQGGALLPPHEPLLLLSPRRELTAFPMGSGWFDAAEDCVDGPEREPSPEPPDLREGKRRALALLESLGPDEEALAPSVPPAEPPTADSPPPRVRRRRVRRRRRSPQPPAPPPPPPPPPAPPALPPQPRSVSRGAAADGSAARLVRCLSPKGNGAGDARC